MSGPTTINRAVAANKPNRVHLRHTMSNVSIRLKTHNGAPIKDERVLLLHGDGHTGEVYQMSSDSSGEVRFANLPIEPTQFVYIVLPDVLEAWSTTPVQEIWGSQNDILDYAQPESPKIADSDTGDKKDAKFTNIRTYRGFNKDAVDKLEKVRVTPGGENPVLMDGAALGKYNRKCQHRTNYRRLDFTKYATSTTTAIDQFKTICVNRLTEDEKFQHHLDAYVVNGGCYTGVSAGKNKYNSGDRTWHIKDGGVCNGFVNLFLGYWYNINAAFTVQTKNEDFINMMESHCDMDSSRQYRGFSDLVEGAMAAPSGVGSVRYKTHRWVSILDAEPAGPIAHVRLSDPSVLNPLATPGYRFIYSNAADPTADPSEFDSQLNAFNIYSKSSDKDKDGDIEYDHHGGVMRRSDSGVIECLAADGYKKGPGRYSEDAIILKTPQKLMKSQPLYLRIWPMRSLERGGYAPALGMAEYKPEAEFAGDDVLDPAFRQSLSRFILWG